MPREPTPAFLFALAVVRRGDRFLLIHEREEGVGWYLPAGGVEPGESFADAAVRETLEESGVPIVLEGVLRVEQTGGSSGTRLRVFFLARPADDTPPRTTPNDESRGAAWFTLAEVAALHLRGDEVAEWLTAVARGFPAQPLSVLACHSAPPLLPE